MTLYELMVDIEAFLPSVRVPHVIVAMNSFIRNHSVHGHFVLNIVADNNGELNITPVGAGGGLDLSVANYNKYFSSYDVELIDDNKVMLPRNILSVNEIEYRFVEVLCEEEGIGRITRVPFEIDNRFNDTIERWPRQSGERISPLRATISHERIVSVGSELKVGGELHCTGQMIYNVLPITCEESVHLPYTESYFQAIRNYILSELFMMAEYFEIEKSGLYKTMYFAALHGMEKYGASEVMDFRW